MMKEPDYRTAAEKICDALENVSASIDDVYSPSTIDLGTKQFEELKEVLWAIHGKIDELAGVLGAISRKDDIF